MLSREKKCSGALKTLLYIVDFFGQLVSAAPGAFVFLSWVKFARRVKSVRSLEGRCIFTPRTLSGESMSCASTCHRGPKEKVSTSLEPLIPKKWPLRRENFDFREENGVCFEDVIPSSSYPQNVGSLATVERGGTNPMSSIRSISSVPL